MSSPATPSPTACPLCQEPGGELVLQSAQFRLIRAQEAGFPLFYRLVWQAHAAEFSDLSAEQRLLCMQAVAAVEQVLRQQLPAELRPHKINLASLGNVVPHLHWHIIARFTWDSHYPDPVWAAPRRQADGQQIQALEAQIPALNAALVQALRSLD